MFKNPKSNTLPLSQNTLKLPSMIKRWVFIQIGVIVIKLVRVLPQLNILKILQIMVNS